MECMKEWVVGAYKHDSCYFTEAQTCQNMECWPWKEKKKKKNHKKGIVSWLIKKKNLGKKWKIIYFFLNYALSWFKSSFNFQASYRMYQIDSFTIILELRIYEFFNHLTLFTCNLFVTCFHEFRICKTTNFFQEIFLILF